MIALLVAVATVLQATCCGNANSESEASAVDSLLELEQ